MSFFRSEKMSLCQMLLHQESAFDCLIQLGYIGVVQFNNPMDVEQVANLKYTSEVQRCSEMQRIIKYFETAIEECGLKVVYYPNVDIEEVPKARDVKDIELVLQKFETELIDVERHYDALRNQDTILLEKLHVLTKADEFLSGCRNTEAVMAWSDSIVVNLVRDESRRAGEDHNVRLGFFAGSIPVERFSAFELMLWRLLRRNYFLKHSEIPVLLEDRQSLAKNKIRKYGFMVFFVGEAIRDKIAKVCQGLRISLFECPETRDERLSTSLRTANALEDLKVILEQTVREKRRICSFIAADLYIWKAKVKKILMVYFVLTKLGMVRHLSNQKYLQAECWIPTKDIPREREALMLGAKHASQGETIMIFPPILTAKRILHDMEPPTFFRLNRFTRGFQNLIDAYGVALYQELNPAPYTIITFPFLFAVMFGDFGHGMLMSVFGIWMVTMEVELERKNKLQAKSNEIWNLLFAGRYIIMMMGLFSMYTGLIYNDFFSKGLNLFGSRWRVNYTESLVNRTKELQLDPALPEFYLGTPYLFGTDPVWDASGEHAIITLNSIKMKLAIILGVAQMIFGLSLSAVNFTYFNSDVDFYFVFLPQLIFILCLFLYLVLLIFLKWSLYGGHNAFPFNSACAPSILITFINMILMKSSSDLPPECPKTMFEGQSTVQVALLIVALLCIPVLLVGKPLHYMRRQKKLRAIKDRLKKDAFRRDTIISVRKSLVYSADYVEESSHVIQIHDDEEPVDIGELWIHQGIHCIESVLGSVSHTASYLRLWALSLAHDQLSTVLWNMVLAVGLRGKNGWIQSFVLYAVFWCWASLTVAILVVMEGLSAFLHTLRLHWVEFQSKFYSGAGEMFFPFRFEPSTMND